MSHLTELELTLYGLVTDKGARQLTGLKQLKLLEASSSGITQAGEHALYAALGADSADAAALAMHYLRCVISNGEQHLMTTSQDDGSWCCCQWQGARLPLCQLDWQRIFSGLVFQRCIAGPALSQGLGKCSKSLVVMHFSLQYFHMCGCMSARGWV